MNNNLIPLPLAEPGKEYTIDHIRKEETVSNNLQGHGVLPGTKIKLLFRSPSGNPCAYEVMGAVLALRHEDSGSIYISSTALS